MIHIFKETIANIDDFFTKFTDPRSKDLFMGSSLYPTLGITVWYLIMVKYILPRFMKSRSAYSLTSVMVYYNLFQVFANLYIVYKDTLHKQQYNVEACQCWDDCEYPNYEPQNFVENKLIIKPLPLNIERPKSKKLRKKQNREHRHHERQRWAELLSIISSGYGGRFDFFRCRELDQSTTDPHTIAGFQAVYIFFLLKFTEFLDTMFFVLRKKENQISFLHLYHHATMAVNTWFAVKISPGGSVILAVGINASVHVVMYTYYLLSGLGPKWQKYLWWKKYMTSFQIIQFIYCILGIFFIYLTRSECPVLTARYPFILYAFAYFVSLLVLFIHFYLRTYKKKEL